MHHSVSGWALVVTTYERISFHRQVRLFVSTNGGAQPDVDDLTVLDSANFDDEISPTAVMYLGVRMTNAGAVDLFQGYVANFQIWLGAHDIPSLAATVMTVCIGCSVCPVAPATCLPSCTPTQYSSTCAACPTTCLSSCDSSQCWQCNGACKTCAGTAATQCLSCRPYMSLDTTTSECKCALGYSQMSSVGRCYKTLARFDFAHPSQYLYDYAAAAPTTAKLGNNDDYYEVKDPMYAGQSRGLLFRASELVTLPHIPSGSLRYAFSVSCFFRDLSTDATKHTLFFKDGGSDVLHVYLAALKVSVGMQYTGLAFTTLTSTVSHDAKWHHVAVTYEKQDEWTRWEVFLDGVSVQSSNYYDKTPEFVDPGTTAYLGSTGTGDFFQGYISAFYLHQGALQATDIIQNFVNVGCGCANGPCVRPSGVCLSLCSLDEYDAGGGVCTKCHVNCGPDVSCTNGSSCFDCPETCVTCKYIGTATDCITCKVKSTMNAGTCGCPSLSTFPDSLKCYFSWSDLSFGDRAGSFCPDLSTLDHYGILGGTIDIYQRFATPIAPKVMTDSRGVYFGSEGQFAHFNQETPFVDPFNQATTLEMWIRATDPTPSAAKVLFSVNTGLPSANVIKLQMYVDISGKLAVETQAVVSLSSQPLGTSWVHVTVVYEDIPTSATTAKPTILVYLNGLRDISHACTSKLVSDPTSLLLIGARYHSSFLSKTNTFTGFISSLAIKAGAAGRFDALRYSLTATCSNANVACSACPKSTGVCINTCNPTESYTANICLACTQTCVDGCYGPPSSLCLECHPNCLTCAKMTQAPGLSAATECTICNVHYARLDPSIIALSRPCECQDGYFSVFDSNNKLRCLRLVREYRIVEPWYPGAVETKQDTDPAWRGASASVELGDPTPVTAERGLYFSGNTYVSLTSGRYMLQCFTVTVWVRIDTVNSNGVLLNKSNSKRPLDGIGVQCKYTSPTLMCSYGAPDGSVALCTVSTPMSTTQWYHLAVTYEQSLIRNEATIEVLLDGLPTNSATCASVFEEEESQPFTFGAEVKSGSATGFKGMLSLIQIWQGTLYKEFIQANLLSSACSGLCAGVCTVCPVCDACPMPFCVTCLSPTGCAGCAGRSFKDNCDFGFYMDSAGACQHCTGCDGCRASGCFKCYQRFCIECLTEYPNGCTKCALNSSWDAGVKDCFINPGYYLKSLSPLVIDPCTLPCVECVNTDTFCTVCVGDMQVHTDGTCTCASGWFKGSLECERCAAHCVKCLGASTEQCKECDATEHWTMGKLACECAERYYFSVIGTCEPCTQHCLGCTTGTFISCTDCEDPFLLFNNMCANRNCTSSEFVDPFTNQCTPCAAQCLTCEMRADLCTSCDTTQYYVGPHTCYSCYTTPGFRYPENQLHSQSSSALDICLEICGDGFNYGQLPCDDGNLQDGDGCSSTCQIEEGYVCTGGSPESKDNCWWTSPPVGFMRLGDYYKHIVSAQPLSLIVQFSQLVEYRLDLGYLTEKDVELHITNTTAFDWNITTSDRQMYTLELRPRVPLTPQHQARLLFFNKSHIRNTRGRRLFNDSLVCSLPDFQPWGGTWDTVLQSLDTASRFQPAFTLLVVAVAVLFHWAMGRPTGTAWRYLEVSQYMHLLRLQEVKFPWQVRLFCQMFAWSNFSFLPNLFTHLSSASEPPPEHFQDHGITSALFLHNAGQAIEVLGLGLLGYVALWLTNRVLRRNGLLKTAETQYWFQGVIRSLLLGSSMILLAAGLQVQTESAASPLHSICAFLSYFSLVGAYAAGIATTWFLVTLTATEAEGPKALRRLSLLYEEHKLDSIPTRSFLVLYYLRRANLSLALAILSPAPTIQAFILALNSLALVMIQAKIAPYRRKWAGNALNLVSDIVLTTAHFLFMGFKVWSDRTAEVVGWALVFMLGGVVLGHFVAMVKDQLRNVSLVLRAHKQATRITTEEMTHVITSGDHSKLFP